MSMTEWAKREIEIAIKKERGDGDPNEWDYGCACYESAYKVANRHFSDIPVSLHQSIAMQRG